MRKLHAVLLTMLLSAASLVAAPRLETIAGVRLGMSATEARQSLEKVGTLTRKERKRQEVWETSRDKRYKAVIISFDAEDHVRFVTGITRQKKVRYSDVIDTKAAKTKHAAPHMQYELAIPTEGGASTQIQVRGTDKKYATYVTLKHVDAAVAADAEKVSAAAKKPAS